MSIEISTRGVGISINNFNDKEFIEIDIYGKLEHKDYEVMAPVIERAVESAGERGLVALADMRDFEGWSIEAAIDDMKLGMQIKDSFEKFAVVGDKKWEEISVSLMNRLCKGEMRYFEDYDKALSWLMG